MPSDAQALEVAKKALWAGPIITAIVVLFLLFDGVTKVARESHVLQAFAQLGYPESAIVGIGTVLLVGTLFYVFPRTTILGAILPTKLSWRGGQPGAHRRPLHFPDHVRSAGLGWGLAASPSMSGSMEIAKI